MAEDVLSQSEIDELLSALSDGSVSAEEVKAEEEERKVKNYDFKRPDRFSKDQIRTPYQPALKRLEETEEELLLEDIAMPM